MYPDCMRIVREKVKPERDRLGLKLDASAKGYAKLWWQYARKGLDLYTAIADMKRVLVRARVSNTNAFTFAPNNMVFSEMIVVFALDDFRFLTLLQSTMHTVWLIYYSSTIGVGAGIRYTPTDCFEPYPFPSKVEELDDIGERYYNYRQSIMHTRREGLTKTYNCFHDPKEKSQEMFNLRGLHREMDEAVAKAYGWDDLNLEHGFHETKQGLRYTISEAARREVLDRLLLLNHQRHEEEVKAGLFDGKGSKGKGKSRGKGVVKEGGGSEKYPVGAGESEVEPMGNGDVEQGALF